MIAWHLSSAARTSRGRVKVLNLDSFYLNGQTLSLPCRSHGDRLRGESTAPFQLYAVLDALGETETGQALSEEALRILQALHGAHPGGIGTEELLYLLRLTSGRLNRAFAEKSSTPQGASMAMLVWQAGMLRLVNVGGCRIYRLRGGKLCQCSTDQTAVQRMVDLGLITAYQARMSPIRHEVRQYLGMPEYALDMQTTCAPELAVRPGDRYLLCSDGLYDMVEDVQLRKLLHHAHDAAEAVDVLTQRALDNGGQDNITALCVEAHGCRHIGRRAPSLSRTEEPT